MYRKGETEVSPSPAGVLGWGGSGPWGNSGTRVASRLTTSLSLGIQLAKGERKPEEDDRLLEALARGWHLGPRHVPWWTLVTGARMGKVTPSPVSTMARDRRRRGSATCAWHHFCPLRPAPVPALLFLESVQARDIPGKRIKEAWFVRREPPAVGFLVRHRADPLHRSCCQAAPAPRSVVWDSSLPPLLQTRSSWEVVILLGDSFLP